MLRPKLAGAWHLHRHLEGEPLDFFVLFSSVASLLGTVGQANYAAGNAFMDALAHYRQARGLPALSLNWGPWDEVGMAARLGLRDRHAHLGLHPIAPDLGLQALSLGLRQALRSWACWPWTGAAGASPPPTASSPASWQPWTAAGRRARRSRRRAGGSGPTWPSASCCWTTPGPARPW